MRTSRINVQMHHLQSLLDGISAGELALPDFQRDFDWGETDVTALLLTVLSGWPAGSLLFLEGESELAVHIRSFETGPTPNPRPRYVVLDGQQRLTSLYQAFFSSGSNTYAIHWPTALSEESGLEEAILSIRNSTWIKRYASTMQQIEAQLVPVPALSTPSTFYEWRDSILEASTPEESDRIKNELGRLYTEILGGLHGYELPAVILDRDLEPAAIARIFERVNRHGIKLGAFDLMVAKVYERDWNLRAQWEAARRDHPRLDRFLGEDGMPVLQTLSLRYQHDVRQSAVLGLNRSLVHDSWKHAAAAVDSGLSVLERNCGVFRRDVLPYQNMALPVCSLFLDSRGGPDSDYVRYWFWRSSFLQEFDVAANTRLVAAYKELRDHEPPNTPVREAVSSRILQEASRKTDKSLWGAFLCACMMSLLRQHSAAETTEMHDGIELEGERAAISSLFSRDLSVPEGSKVPLHLRILGLVILPESVSGKLSRASPGEVGDIIARNGLTDLCQSQFLDEAAIIAADRGDFATVFESRIRGLQSFLDSETGGSVRIE